MIPAISTSSANFSGVHLKQTFTGDEGSSGVVQKILPAIRNNKTFPHCTSSVAWGSPRQNSRSQSMWKATMHNINVIARRRPFKKWLSGDQLLREVWV